MKHIFNMSDRGDQYFRSDLFISDPIYTKVFDHFESKRRQFLQVCFILLQNHS